MPQVFVSHAEEDWAVVSAVAEAIEKAGFSTWYYERDSVPGPPYLDQVSQAVSQCEAFLLVVSQDSIRSHQVDAEVILAFETHKRFLPVLSGVTHSEFQERKPGWRLAVGAATSIAIPPVGVHAILDRIVTGAKVLGLRSTAVPERPQISAAPSSEPAIECSLFAPERIALDEQALIHAWLHTSAQADDVARTSAEFDETVQLRGRKTVSASLPLDAQIRLSLEVGKMPVRSLSTELTWHGGPNAVIFKVGPPERDTLATVVSTGGSPAVGRILLSHAGVLIGKVNFKLPQASEAKSAVTKNDPARWRKAFVCYASTDRAEVLRRTQMLSTVGIQSFVDLDSISPGEHWERQLFRAIDEADVFLLFWSHAAQQSEWVEREWRYALNSKGLEFIVPISLETPMPSPPRELAELHFSPSLAYIG